MLASPNSSCPPSNKRQAAAERSLRTCAASAELGEPDEDREARAARHAAKGGHAADIPHTAEGMTYEPVCFRVLDILLAMDNARVVNERMLPIPGLLGQRMTNDDDPHVTAMRAEAASEASYVVVHVAVSLDGTQPASASTSLVSIRSCRPGRRTSR